MTRDDMLARAAWHADQAAINARLAQKYPHHRKRWMRAFREQNAAAHQRAAQALIRRANAAGLEDQG